jgi:hypothetical protein
MLATNLVCVWMHAYPDRVLAKFPLRQRACVGESVRKCGEPKVGVWVR